MTPESLPPPPTFRPRPVLAFCLGHQVMAQALGGLVQPRSGPGRHYALQESELLLRSPSASPSSPAVLAIVDAVATVRREAGDGDGGRGAEARPGSAGDRGGENGEDLPPPPLKLLYHHNDEVGGLFGRCVGVAMPLLYTCYSSTVRKVEVFFNL